MSAFHPAATGLSDEVEGEGRVTSVVSGCPTPQFVVEGVTIRARAIGMFRMRDEAGGDDKVLCVPSAEPRQEHLQDIRHLDEFYRLEIEHFFQVYKDLEPGKSVEGSAWVGRREAELEIERSWARAKDAGFKT